MHLKRNTPEAKVIVLGEPIKLSIYNKSLNNPKIHTIEILKQFTDPYLEISQILYSCVPLRFLNNLQFHTQQVSTQTYPIMDRFQRCGFLKDISYFIAVQRFFLRTCFLSVHNTRLLFTVLGQECYSQHITGVIQRIIFNV